MTNQTIQRLADAGRWTDVISRTERALETADQEALWNRGWAFFKLERFEEAIATFEQCVTLSKPGMELAITHWGLGCVLASCGQAKAAETSFKSSLEARDGYLPRVSLATLLLTQGRSEEAEEVHREGIALRPGDGRRLAAYADFLDDIGRTSEASSFRTRAEAALLQSLKDNPDNSTQRRRYAEFLDECGRSEEAERIRFASSAAPKARPKRS